MSRISLGTTEFTDLRTAKTGGAFLTPFPQRLPVGFLEAPLGAWRCRGAFLRSSLAVFAFVVAAALDVRRSVCLLHDEIRPAYVNVLKLAS